MPRAFRHLVLATLATLASPFAAAQSDGAAWPTRAIRMIVPFGAGGTTDLPARLLAEKLGSLLGQAVVTEFRPGAGTVIGTEAAARARPDGYTLVTFATSHAIGAAVGRNLPYDVQKDFVPISQFLLTSQVLMVSPQSGITSVSQLIAQARANPGKLNYGAPGLTSSHFAGEMFKGAAKVDITYVGYKSSAEVPRDLATNRVQLSFETATSATAAHASGLTRAIAVTGMTRLPALPDVPTVHESGLPGFEFSAWMGLAAPAATPPAIVSQLIGAMAQFAQMPDVSQRFQQASSKLVHVPGAAFGEILQSDISKFRAAGKAMNVNMN